MGCYQLSLLGSENDRSAWFRKARSPTSECSLGTRGHKGETGTGPGFGLGKASFIWMGHRPIVTMELQS